MKCELDRLYHRLNRREFVYPDPLAFLYAYNDIREREIAGLIASSLAYGRVAQILNSVAIVLNLMNPSPYLFLKHATYSSLCNELKHFTHRFATGAHMAAFCWGIRDVIARYGSLQACFADGMSRDDETVISAMTYFTRQLMRTKGKPGHLIADPKKKSACKRLNLFLRWMVRKDRVDPGGWKNIPKNKLIIPLDTHMHRICIALGLTNRKQSDMRTALEVTSGFKKLEPNDPVKYDFCLTRFGIRNDLGMLELNRMTGPLSPNAVASNLSRPF